LICAVPVLQRIISLRWTRNRDSGIRLDGRLQAVLALLPLARRTGLLAGQILVFAAFFGFWELAVRLLHTRPVILPAPSVIFATIWEQRDLLLANTWPTCVAIGLGFAAAVISGFILAIGIS